MSHANIVSMSVSGTPGTGTVTLGSAIAGFQSFSAAYGANKTIPGVLFQDFSGSTLTGQEVCENCVYDHSAGTITRGTRVSSSSGGALTLSSAAVVSVVATAATGNKLEAALQAVTPGGRLTLESGVPVPTTDQTAKTSIYYTPFIHNIINLWNGSAWTPISFTEYTLALGTLTSGKPYDIFAYLSSGALALEVLVWTDDTTRATAVTLQDGRYCKSGDKTRLLLGSFYTTSTTTTESSQVNRYVANVYNAVPQRMFSCPAYVDNNTVTSYSHTSTTWAEANGGTGSRLNYVLPLPALASIVIQAVGDPGGATSIGAGIGNDSATNASIELLGVTSTRISASTVARFQQAPGKHYGALLLRVSGGTGTIYADNNRSGGASDPALTHIHGEVLA